MPFLTFYVPTYKRPKMLADCLASIKAQSDRDYEVVLIRDEVGIGIDGMYGDIRNHAQEVSGDYVFVLSDDNLVTDTDFVKGLKEQAADSPDVIVFKNQIVGVLPSIWEGAPELGQIDLSCFAVRRDIWQKHAADWGECYAGDYYFIRALWDAGYRFKWWDKLVIRAQKIMRGQPE